MRIAKSRGEYGRRRDDDGIARAAGTSTTFGTRHHKRKRLNTAHRFRSDRVSIPDMCRGKLLFLQVFHCDREAATWRLISLA